MADETENTPEETPEVVEETTAEAPAEEAPVEETPAPEAEAPAEEAGEPAPVLTKKEQRTAARHVVTSKRPSRTPEERNAERLAERTRKAAARRRRREKAKTARAGAERGPAKTASTAEHGPGRPKVRQGLVVSDKADKTITVRVDSARRHRRYEKVVRSSSTLHAHDEANDANEGDLVQIMESRPLSRLKRWRLVEVLERAK
ncbi:MAG: small subunit ribosomal protein [Solirubrobacteraceae bacterium]|nr:small subunit ribosomal protein [Solirubrobacteraceae bacterium]